MKSISWLLKLALPDKLDWIGDLVDDIMEIALEWSNGWTKTDEELVAHKVAVLLEREGVDPADAKTLGQAASIICRKIAETKPLKRRRLLK